MDRRTFIAGTGAFLIPLTSSASRPRSSETYAGRVVEPLPVVGAQFRYLALDADFVYSRPCFAPDGRRILYMRTPATSDPITAINSNASPWSLWTAAVDEGEPELLFERAELGATRPDWNWATGRIVLTGIRRERAELWVLDADGRNLTHVPVGDPPRTRLFYPSWYPEGNAVAVTDYETHEILRIDIATGEVEPLTDPAQVWAGMCSVSPDSRGGNPIAFAGQRPGDSYGVRHNRIWMLRPGSRPIPLDPEHGRTPAWSPAGNVLAFSSVRRRPAPSFTLHPRRLPGGISAIYLHQEWGGSDPGGSTAAVSPFDVSTIHAKWSPDGSALVCMASDVAGPRRGLALIEFDA
jgi:Tol biopolymer transport system component